MEGEGRGGTAPASREHERVGGVWGGGCLMSRVRRQCDALSMVRKNALKRVRYAAPGAVWSAPPSPSAAFACCWYLLGPLPLVRERGCALPPPVMKLHSFTGTWRVLHACDTAAMLLAFNPALLARPRHHKFPDPSAAADCQHRVPHILRKYQSMALTPPSEKALGKARLLSPWKMSTLA